MNLRKAAEQALKQLQRDDVYLGHRSKTRADAITVLRQALEQPEQKHVIDCTDEQLIEEVRRRGFVIRDAQIGREWVGLTRRELDIATLGMEDLGDCYIAIEAKLKEKNT